MPTTYICSYFCTHKYNVISDFFRNPTPTLVSEKYMFCQKCFNDVPGESVPLGDDPSQPLV